MFINTMDFVKVVVAMTMICSCTLKPILDRCSSSRTDIHASMDVKNVCLQSQQLELMTPGTPGTSVGRSCAAFTRWNGTGTTVTTRASCRALMDFKCGSVIGSAALRHRPFQGACPLFQILDHNPLFGHNKSRGASVGKRVL